MPMARDELLRHAVYIYHLFSTSLSSSLFSCYLPVEIFMIYKVSTKLLLVVRLYRKY